ncbi:MAG: cobalt-precorrin-5B (C(1))-methyltransferase [Rhodospirillales bacterium]|nr:cobalt-precorrin-5B (C(1))-methyltransferase [Rhodospirillales bacterium]
MDDSNAFQDDDEKPLRYGWTTGACATAAAKAAFQALITGNFPYPVEIRLPKGKTPAFDLAESKLGDGFATAAIIKDAGDDPDVTHGATIEARVQWGADEGIVFKAGEGVGTVTKPGLLLAVGEPAINPAPRQMIIDNLSEIATTHKSALNVEVTISVRNGEALAQKTWNGRLGIVGGLSILGTTGIVVPYSCSAWIASIRQVIDVGRAAGLKHMAATTGSTSEKTVSKIYGFDETSIIDMGDFAGGALKYLRDNPVPRITLAGGFGKLAKLAAGHLDLHSKRSQVDMEFLAGLAKNAGASSKIIQEIEATETAAQALLVAKREDVSLGDTVAARARDTALGEVNDAIDIEVIVIDRAGIPVGRAGFSKP